MLCLACQQLLRTPQAIQKYTHHSKECRLWPFGFYERLCLLGCAEHPQVKSLFASYRVSVIPADGTKALQSIVPFFSSLDLSFTPLPCFSSLIEKNFSLPRYYLSSESATSFLTSSLTSGDMKRHIERVEVRWKNEELGWGLFAKERFQKGERVDVYSGEVRKLSLFTREKELSYTAELTRPFPSSRPLVVDAKETGSLSRFINHSDEPNLGVEFVSLVGLPFLLIDTIRDVEPGEELFLSYGKDFWKHRALS